MSTSILATRRVQFVAVRAYALPLALRLSVFTSLSMISALAAAAPPAAPPPAPAAPPAAPTPAAPPAAPAPAAAPAAPTSAAPPAAPTPVAPPAAPRPAAPPAAPTPAAPPAAPTPAAPPAAPTPVAAPATNPPATPPAAPAVSDTTADASQDETNDAVGNEDIVVVGTPAVIAGSAISSAALERQETDDIHKALLAVAGVHVRDEDGYGLRPNIGMRGAAVERSAKVALMEDGVPIAPAPYSAPAAYYFPLTTRMSKIEAIKGPTAIQYGPNTVGGALNMQAAPLADARSAYLDIAAGAYRYGKLHARATEVRDCWAVQGEYVHLRSNGFKQLDGGGNTGFAKHDASLRGKWRALTWLVGYAHEDSNETYLGLTDEDFAKNPQRRYAASRNDHMQWQHWRMRADYLATLGSARILTTAYRNDFSRVWGKVDGLFGAPNAATVIAAPAANQIYYQILAGLADSESPEDELLFGINDRTFVSQGVQSTASWNVRHGAGMHFVDVGLRLHHDNALRIRYEEGYRMTGGAPLRSARARNTTVNSDTRALALAAFVHDRLMWKKLEAVGGVRVEAIRADVVDHLATNPAKAQHTAGDIAIIPGLGAKYQLVEPLALLIGVHRGFAPAPPTADGAQKPELSVNYEAGARFASKRAALDIVGFIADYSNLKGACTLSAGCTAAQEGDQFDGGKARVVGIEAQGSAEVQARHVRFPVNMAYTFAHSAFLTTFASDFASWGNVKRGDALPYLPAHQLAAQAAAATNRWELGASLRWQSNARDIAGTGTPSPATTVYGATVFGISAHAYLHKHAELYATVDNLFNDQVIVARRPYGARPNSPRLFTLGYKARF